ncbi:hypothetical protein CRG98_022355 [Punica granatum]|uniref:Uncharacterized protein n=1 Tax=Punica granatum TaxID=22663 RepID=A0A2I0JLV3_PUNGR|nr:hypothetical protein CRG98_022355 [Punica granatum]
MKWAASRSHWHQRTYLIKFGRSLERGRRRRRASEKGRGGRSGRRPGRIDGQDAGKGLSGQKAAKGRAGDEQRRPGGGAGVSNEEETRKQLFADRETPKSQRTERRSVGGAAFQTCKEDWEIRAGPEEIREDKEEGCRAGEARKGGCWRGTARSD